MMSHFPDNTNLIIGWFKDELNAQAYAAVDGIKEKLTNYYHAHDFMTEDLNLIVNMVTDELHKLQATTSRAEVLALIDSEIADWNAGKVWQDYYMGGIKALTLLRALIAADQGKGQQPDGEERK